ncbi:hypothetical protein ACJRO7_030960 [Eucalyptus globulus]|uniref:Fungal lipase-type domain-containing protein n=1 Tax=Eucalyptus globulus TaxID=34317 RepID=A0ABD3JD98_EUCGL
MLLSPEKVGVIDLFRILIHTDVHKRYFVDSSKEGGESFKRTWIMFVSILAQKLQLLVAKPLSWSRSTIEFWLNLLSSNQNLRRLLVNFFSLSPSIFEWKVVMPDKESGSFLSIIGNLDKRVELDKSIRPVISFYRADVILGFYNFWNDYRGKAATQAFMLRDRDTIMVAFRGTEPFNVDDWCSDIDLSWYESPSVGKIHGGFMKALGLQKNLGWPKELDPRLKTPAPSLLGDHDDARYVLTGHSLGGALAILFPAILAVHGETWLMDRLEGVYTFGQPRVGDEKFGQFMERVLKEHQIEYFRLVYANGIVPRLPYDNSSFLFKHYGSWCYFDSKSEGKIVQEEPNKNYFSPLQVIPMMMNAWYYYKEGFLLRIFRVVGQLGIPAHAPQDYVNATRLGGSQLFLHQINHE